MAVPAPQAILKIVYSLKDSSEYEIQKGLVVPKGSIVSIGLPEAFREAPTSESSSAMFKMLFGVRNKKRIVVDDEDDDIVKVDDSDTSESECSEAESATPDGSVVDDDDED